MAIELITGRAGEPHVDSFDVGAFNATLFGSGAYVLSGVEATLVDANNVSVSAGELLCEGRHIRITGAGEGLAIDNGLSSYKRHDIIAAKYTRGEDGIEAVELVVIKGDNSTTAPSDPPMPTAGKLIDGASEVYWPLYRIVVDGLAPQTPVFIAQRQALYTLGLGTEIPAGADLNDYVTPGIYYVATRAIAETVGNIPVGRFGSLVVQDVSNEIIQTYRSGSTGEVYTRHISNGTYHGWVCIGGIDSIVAEGTSGNWTYWKFANGLAILRYHEANATRTWTADATIGGVLYAKDASAPFSIKNACVCGSASSSRYTWAGISGNSCTNVGGTNTNLSWMRSAKSTSYTEELNATIVATWK